MNSQGLEKKTEAHWSAKNIIIKQSRREKETVIIWIKPNIHKDVGKI
jgi:hypothetical protein